MASGDSADIAPMGFLDWLKHRQSRIPPASMLFGVMVRTKKPAEGQDDFLAVGQAVDTASAGNHPDFGCRLCRF